MPAAVVRHIGTKKGTSTYKVTDDKVVGGEAVVIVVQRDPADEPSPTCLTCSAYKCQHAVRVMRRIKDGR